MRTALNVTKLGTIPLVALALMVTSVFGFSEVPQHITSAAVAETASGPDWAALNMAAPAVCRASSSTQQRPATTPAFTASTLAQPPTGPDSNHDHHCYYELVEYCDYFDGGFEYCWYEWEWVCD